MASDTLYYFALKTIDDVGNISDRSNSAKMFPPWDVNFDGMVNIFDLIIVAKFFGEARALKIVQVFFCKKYLEGAVSVSG
jgi:hypothetical protein